MAATKRKMRGRNGALKKEKVPKAIERIETPQQETQASLTSSMDQVATTSLLSADLIEDLGGQESGGTLVLPGRRKKKPKMEHVPTDLLEQAKHTSKSKRKKLEAIATKKRQEARRERLYQSLTTLQMPQNELKLLYSTSQLGHKETLRERLKRAVNRQKAGLDLSADAQRELYPIKDRKDDEEVKETMAYATLGKNTAQSEENAPCLPVNETATGQKKRRYKKPAMISRSVPMVPMPEQEPRHVSDRVTSNESVPVDESVQEAKRASSHSTAMAKLDALRQKNAQKRRSRQAEPRSPETVPPTEAAGTVKGYIPHPIVLKTTDEMREWRHRTPLPSKPPLVTLSRKSSLQVARLQLPVCRLEQEIMEAIHDHDVVILCGETGSGKTTQVPQFLYEAGYGHPRAVAHRGRIGVTQPRRVAAVATAKRVADELNVPFGAANGHVGYQIRYDADHLSAHTRIKFMTDGILLQEIQQDFLLRQYSILLLDEAHERNVNTDILIGLLSRIAPLRAQMAHEEAAANALRAPDEQAVADRPLEPLKLVIMSATLRVADFTQNRRLFPTPPPVLRVDARQYPVTVHFAKRTELVQYVDEAYKKVVKIHRKLPPGGVLVFLTGQREIRRLCHRLRRTFSMAARHEQTQALARRRAKQAQRRAVDPASRTSTSDEFFREHDESEEEADEEEAHVWGPDEDDDSVASTSDAADDEAADDDVALPYMHVLPLFALLPHDDQMQVFEPPPDRHRLIVVATNVAETSLTIPGIKYVVDAGRTKERKFDRATNVSSFHVTWISKASADQRAGRAGRTGPGHCYRLYSSAVYATECPSFAPPAILGQPIEDLVLRMKAMGIHDVVAFPFPTPPAHEAVKQALQTLVHLGAISAGPDETITRLGRALVQFPVAARYAKMLLLAQKLHVLEYTIAMVAGLSGHSPFLRNVDEQDDAEARDEPKEEPGRGTEAEEADARRKLTQWVDQDSDVLSLLRAAGAYAYTGGSREFCTTNYLHAKSMHQMLELRHQLTRIVNKVYAQEQGGTTVHVTRTMPPPDPETQVVLRQIVTAGFVDHVAKRVPAGTITHGTKIERNCAYMTAVGSSQEPVYIHPRSGVFARDPKTLPDYVVYQYIMRTSRAYMTTVTAIAPEWLAWMGKETPLCKYAPPLSEPPPFYNQEVDEVQCYARALYGTHQWALPVMCMAYPEGGTIDLKDDVGGKYRWFAKFLLDNQVIPKLIPFSNALKEPSHTLIRKKFDKKVQLLVVKLEQHHVASRRALVMKWGERDGKAFLKAELLGWIKESYHNAFNQAWGSLVSTAVHELSLKTLEKGTPGTGSG